MSSVDKGNGETFSDPIADLQAQLAEADKKAVEVDATHHELDLLGVPKSNEYGVEFSLIGRIRWMQDQAHAQAEIVEEKTKRLEERIEWWQRRWTASEAENKRLRNALALAGIPLEVLQATMTGRGYFTAELEASIREAVEAVRQAIAAQGQDGG